MPIEQYDSVINNIQKICNKILDMKSQFERLELNMHVNINYLAKLFAMRMFDQLKAMFALSNNENHILISRSMFEGNVYISCCYKDPDLAKDYRNYAYVIDQKHVESCDKAPAEIIEILENYKKEIDGFRKKNKKNGKFYHSWTKGSSIESLSSTVELKDFYDKYYSNMSDFHHWGVRSFGIRYECLENNIKRLNTPEIKLESVNAWCMSTSAIINVLELLSTLANNKDLINELKKIKEELKIMENIKITEITYNHKKD